MKVTCLIDSKIRLINVNYHIAKNAQRLGKGNENLLLHVCICLDNLLLKIVSKYTQEKFEIYLLFPSALQ
jgi:hypothetical protein